MKRLLMAALALAGAVLASVGYPSGPALAQAALAQPCVVAPCKLAGAAVKVTIPLPLKPGSFAGKFELVPLFDAGHRPVIRNGHQYLALRNTITFERPNGERVSMPAGQVTDLASIPQVFWPLLPPDGTYAEASVPHDLCFKSKGSFVWFKQTWRTRPTPYTRSECNEILREAMVAIGVPAWKRIVIYEGVQAGGVVAPGAWGS